MLRQLEEVVSEEEVVLAQMHRLLRELPPGDPYRAVIEQHLLILQEAVDRLVALRGGGEPG